MYNYVIPWCDKDLGIRFTSLNLISNPKIPILFMETTYISLNTLWHISTLYLLVDMSSHILHGSIMYFSSYSAWEFPNWDMIYIWHMFVFSDLLSFWCSQILSPSFFYKVLWPFPSSLTSHFLGICYPWTSLLTISEDITMLWVEIQPFRPPIYSLFKTIFQAMNHEGNVILVYNILSLNLSCVTKLSLSHKEKSTG